MEPSRIDYLELCREFYRTGLTIQAEVDKILAKLADEEDADAVQQTDRD